MNTMMPFDRMSRLMSPWHDDQLERIFAAPFASLVSSERAGFKMNVEDAGENYLVTAELPGVTRDMLDVELNEGRLSISVEKKESEEEKAKNYLYKETNEWSATRGVYLKDAATEGLSAKLADGLLVVTVPKQQEKNNVTKISID